MKRALFLVFLIQLFYTPFLHSTSILVQNKGEFDAAVSSSTPGDTILLKNGTWTDVVLEFYAQGTAGNPIVLSAEKTGDVILTGSSRLEIYGKYLEVHNLDFKDGANASGDAVISFRRNSSQLAENCRLTNCRILNYNPATDDIEYKWVSIYGKNNRVDHCTFSGKNHEGALLVVWLNGSANYHQIDHNYFSDIPALGRNGAETIRIGTSTNSMTESRTMVEYNVFEKCDGELEIISNKSGFNIYRYNTFRNNNGGLTLRHGNDCEVYGNFFFGASGKPCGGVRIIGERHKVYNNYFQDLEGSSTRAAISMMNGVVNSPLNRYFQVKNAEVVHNTIVSCKQAFAFGVGKNAELSLPPLDCMIANNVVDKTTGNDLIDYNDTPINVTYSRNFFFDNNLSISDTGIVNTDPQLVLINDLWRATASSSIEDAANITFSYLTTDMDGQLRDTRPDVGSDEVSQEQITNVPLSMDDVGANLNDHTSIASSHLSSLGKVFVHQKVIYVKDVPREQFPFQLKVYDALTKLVYEQTIFEVKTSISLPKLRGVYIIQIIGSSNTSATEKFWF